MDVYCKHKAGTKSLLLSRSKQQAFLSSKEKLYKNLSRDTADDTTAFKASSALLRGTTETGNRLVTKAFLPLLCQTSANG